MLPATAASSACRLFSASVSCASRRALRSRSFLFSRQPRDDSRARSCSERSPSGGVGAGRLPATMLVWSVPMNGLCVSERPDPHTTPLSHHRRLGVAHTQAPSPKKVEAAAAKLERERPYMRRKQTKTAAAARRAAEQLEPTPPRNESEMLPPATVEAAAASLQRGAIVGGRRGGDVADQVRRLPTAQPRRRRAPPARSLWRSRCFCSCCCSSALLLLLRSPRRPSRRPLLPYVERSDGRPCRALLLRDGERHLRRGGSR